MHKKVLSEIPVNRLEAFSDGVIAIIITIMVFDLKLPPMPPEAEWPQVADELQKLWPRFTAYVLSFIVLGIMWINHSHLTHRLKKSDGVFLWHNLHLLFWMSLIPFATNLLGERHEHSLAVAGYGLVMFFNSTAFMFMRRYADHGLLHAESTEAQKRRINQKNLRSMGIYALSIAFAFVSVYVSYFTLLLVPLMYFLPTQDPEAG